MISETKDNKGFTLIELLVAMAIGSIVMAAIYMTFRSQQQSYLVQEEVAAMQQNLRAAMYYIEKELKTAGCDPDFTADAALITANANSINFTRDIRGAAVGSHPDGDANDPDENITYSLVDADGDGDMDLVRDSGGGNILIAENINSLSFVYRDGAGNVLDDDGGGNVNISIPQIRSIDVSLAGTHNKTLATRILCRNLGI